MKLWLLRPREDIEETKNPWRPWYDKCFGFVVRAETEIEARKIAQENAGDEKMDGVAPWTDPLFSDCSELLAAGEAEIIIKDFAAA